MSISNLTARPLGSGAVRLSWTSSGNGPFRVFRDGIEIARTLLRSYDVTLLSGEAPLLEVLDDLTTPPQHGFPGYFILTWYAAANAESYLVQEFVASVWTTRKSITDTGEGYYTYTSPVVADGVTHQFRVVPVGVNQNQGTLVNMTSLMVRIPDVPRVRYTYSNSNKRVTIAQA